MMRRKDNYSKAISALNGEREDHYDGVNAIYRLAAVVPIPNDTSPDGVRRQLKRLVKDLSTQKVRANRIYVYEQRLNIDFYPKGFQMVMTRGQYAGLQLEFAEFLNQTGIREIVIQDGCYADDPEDSVRTVSNDEVNFFPEFNSKCFGAKEGDSIEILNFSSIKLDGEAA